MTTIKIKTSYYLTEAAQTALTLSAGPTPAYQEIGIEVDAAEAIEAGVAFVATDGRIIQGEPQYQRNDCTTDRAGCLLSGAVYDHEVMSTTQDPKKIDWPSTEKLDHILTVEEAVERYRATLEARRQHSEKIKANQEAAKQERLKERANRTAELREAIPHFLAGDITGLPSAPAESDLTAAEKEIIRAYVQARDEKIKADKESAEAAARAERDAWIRAHGSSRLRKGLDLGEIKAMANVYRDERIAHDLGTDWIAWKAAPEPDDNDLLNPSEAALDALAAADEKFPTWVRLRSVGGMDKHGDEHDWRPALMIDCPWDTSVTAIKYLD